VTRKTWRDLARQQAGNSAPTPPDLASLGELSAQVPALQRLLQQRQTLEQQMQALGGQTGARPISRVYPVASAAERQAEQAQWEQRRSQQRSQQQQANATASLPWSQQRDNLVGRAREAVMSQQQGQLNLTQRLDQRVTQARNNALARLQQARSDELREPLLRPLTDRLNSPFGSAAGEAPPIRDATSLQRFDDRYAERQRRLLGVEAGALEQLQERREQALDRRLEERREARRNERQQDLLQQRASERRSQRPHLSTD